MQQAFTNKPERVSPFSVPVDSVLAKGVAIRDRTRFQLLGSEMLVHPPKSEIHQATDD